MIDFFSEAAEKRARELIEEMVKQIFLLFTNKTVQEVLVIFTVISFSEVMKYSFHFYLFCFSFEWGFSKTFTEIKCTNMKSEIRGDFSGLSVGSVVPKFLNPYLPSGLFRSYELDQSI